ncbi:MAG: hypothetical protein IJF03_11655 [Lachnospiraceae bacterium]|nr:hypothetical protein [Lachnospiraceae bacterium]
MFRILKFGWIDIKIQKKQFFVYMIQIVFSCLLICYMLQTFVSYKTALKKIEYISNNKEIYVLKDEITEKRFEELVNDNAYIHKFQQLIDVIDRAEVELLIVNNNYCTNLQNGKIEADIMEVSSNFFEKYKLQGNFTQEEIENNFVMYDSSVFGNGIEEIPVILGSDYSKYYEKGEVIRDDFGGKYKVIGLLEKNSSIVLPMQGKELIELRNVIICPTCIDKSDQGNMLDYIFSCQFLVEKRQELDMIEQKNRELKLLDTYFECYDYQIDIVKNDTYEAMVLFGCFGGIIFVFSVIGIFCMLIENINRKQYEYAINMLCGATLTDIFIRILFPVMCLMMSGVAVCIIVWGGVFGTWFILFIAVVVFLLTAVFAFYQIKSKTIITRIRKEEW